MKAASRPDTLLCNGTSQFTGVGRQISLNNHVVLAACMGGVGARIRPLLTAAILALQMYMLRVEM